MRVRVSVQTPKCRRPVLAHTPRRRTTIVVVRQFVHTCTRSGTLFILSPRKIPEVLLQKSLQSPWHRIRDVFFFCSRTLTSWLRVLSCHSVSQTLARTVFLHATDVQLGILCVDVTVQRSKISFPLRINDSFTHNLTETGPLEIRIVAFPTPTSHRKRRFVA